MHNDVTFQWSFHNFDYDSHPTIRPPGTHRIYVEYSNRDVNIENQVPLVDFNAFVSAVGGAMGLFLGFSIIDTMTFIYQVMFRLIEKYKERQ